jgi:hypothetical protein
VIVARPRQPARDHVRVTDRLDLLETELVGDVVETREHGVETAHELVGREARGELRESDDVAEEHGPRFEPIGDHARGLLETLRDRAREDVEEQVLAPRALHVERVHLLADDLALQERESRLQLELERSERSDRPEGEEREVQ